MGFDRDDDRYGREQGLGRRQQGGGGDYGRSGVERDRGDGGADRVSGGRPPRGYDYEDRGFFDRAGDEVRSWFGDEEAERRRRFDERFAQRDYDRDQARYGRDTSDRWSAAYIDAGLGMPIAGYGWSGGRGEDQRNGDHDPNYRSWRDRQIEALDRDYDDYRREHQSKFDSEFATWRGRRQGQRDALSRVEEHQEVVGSDGQHVGKVDHVRGDRILLAKNDAAAGGHHHSIPSSWIVNVGDKVEIDRTAEQAQRAWKDEERESATGGRETSGSGDRGVGGPRNLNRSFSGTY